LLNLSLLRLKFLNLYNVIIEKTIQNITHRRLNMQPIVFTEKHNYHHSETAKLEIFMGEYLSGGLGFIDYFIVKDKDTFPLITNRGLATFDFTPKTSGEHQIKGFAKVKSPVGNEIIPFEYKIYFRE
jgi:hypothetical protein